MRTIRLEEIEPTRIGDACWKPIRSLLDIGAFGVNAYVAESTGATLFDEHDETEEAAGAQRHQELYVVLAGRATFTCGGREVDAPAGTLVFLEDPAERRGARAAEAGTTVLAIGGPVGERYRVAPWEYSFRFRRAQARGATDEARAVAAEALAAYPDDHRLRDALGTGA